MINQIEVNWQTLKNFVDARQLSIQYIDIHEQYYLVAADTIFALSCRIQKSTPASSDQTDFETNYLANANKTPRIRTNTKGAGTFLWAYTQTAGSLASVDIVVAPVEAGAVYDDVAMLTSSGQPSRIQLVLRKVGVGDTVIYDISLNSGQLSFLAWLPGFRQEIPNDGGTYQFIAKGQNNSLLSPMSATISGVKIKV